MGMDGRGWAVVLALAASLLVPRPARADSRPTSGDMSVLSGRTFGTDQTVLAAGLGWPGFWAQVLLAPSPRLNVGIRADVLYGSPIMGVGTGVGGQLSVPIRLHVFGQDTLDLAVQVRPYAVTGEGSTVGEKGLFSSEVGWGAGAEAWALLGYRASDIVTLAAGLGGSGGYVDVPDSDQGGDGVGTLLVRAGVEALMARDTMLFAEVVGGYGLAPDRRFDGHGVVRVSLGVGYLLD
jgi:hypothetical protein